MKKSEDSGKEKSEDSAMEEDKSKAEVAENSDFTCLNLVHKQISVVYKDGDRDDKSVIMTQEELPIETRECVCVAHHPERKAYFRFEDVCPNCRRSDRCKRKNTEHDLAIDEEDIESDHWTRCCCERCFPEINEETILHANRHCDDYDCCCLQHKETEQYDYPTALQSVSANTTHDMSKQVSARQPGMHQSSGEMPSGSKHHHQPTMTGPAPSPQQSPIVNPSQQLNRHLAIPYFRREDICDKCCRNRNCQRKNRRFLLRGAADRTGSEVSQYASPTALQSVSANPAHDMSKQMSAGQPGMYRSSGGMTSGAKHHHQPTTTGPAPSPQPSPRVNPSQQLNRHVAIPEPKEALKTRSTRRTREHISKPEDNRPVTRQRAKEIERMQKTAKSAHDKVCGWLGLKNCAPGDLKLSDEESSEPKNQEDKDKDKDT